MKGKLLVGTGCLALLMGCANVGKEAGSSPSFVVTTPVVELRPGGKVIMYGTGFAPKQEVRLLLKDAGGGLSGISSAVSPPPVANAEGVWAGAWDYSRYMRSLKPGTAVISVTDENYKPLMQAPVVFVAPPKPKPKPAAKPAAKR